MQEIYDRLLGWVFRHAWLTLGMAAAVLVVLVLMNRSHIYSLVPYLLVGAVLWYCVFMSGVHSTIAGRVAGVRYPVGVAR